MSEERNRLVLRIARAWEESILLELTDELKTVPLQQRPVALAVIHERTVYYAFKKVAWYTGQPDCRARLAPLEEKMREQILLAEYLSNEKYARIIIEIFRRLLPRWQAGESATFAAHDTAQSSRDIPHLS